MNGCVSSCGLFTPEPRFTGGDHGSDVLPRVETHTSVSPIPPPPSEKQNNASPSDRLEDCRVNRRAEIHGWSPGVVDAGSVRHPYVRTTEPACAKRPEV